MSHSIKIVIIVSIFAQIFIQLNSGQKIAPIFCTDTKSCESLLGNGSQCSNNQCVCGSDCRFNPGNATKTRVNIIGDDCSNDDNCQVELTFCLDGKCVCKLEYVESGNKRKCLKVSGGLNQPCQESIQCDSKVENSICNEHNKCTCAQDYHRAKFRCLPNIDLGSPCKTIDECSHIKFSQCYRNVCFCLDGYVTSTLNKTLCLPIANATNRQCEEDDQCRQLHGPGAICYQHKCSCDKIHHLVNKTDCPSNLRKSCNRNENCFHYNEDDSIYCQSGVCECMDPYYEIDGYCSNVSKNASISISFIILYLFLFKLL